MKPMPWLRVLIFVVFAASLVANFFSLGYVFKSQRDAPAIGVLAKSAFSAYPEEVRVEFRRILRENRARTVAALRELREARRQLESLASVSPLNEPEVERAMRDVRTATDALQRLMQGFLLQALQAKEQAKTHS